MSDVIEAFPLTWPIYKPRTKNPECSRFRTALGVAINGVQEEIRKLGGVELIISSNLPLKRNGMPYATQTQPKDVGVAIYFKYKKKPMCFACDRWDRIESNMWALANTVDALRGISRWGTGDMMEAAFTGFIALPAPTQPWQELELETSDPTPEEVEEAYRRLAAKYHPDRPFGDADRMARINAARDALTA